MFNSPRKRFNKNSIRIVTVVLFFAAFLTYLFTSRTAQVQVPVTSDKEPIAFTGHGAMFNEYGQEIVPTIKFIREAQEWYLARLSRKLTKNQNDEFLTIRPQITKDFAIDEQSKLVVNSSLLDMLTSTVEIKDRNRFLAKMNLLKSLLKEKLTNNQDIRLPRSKEKFQLDPKLDERIKTTTRIKISVNQRTYEIPRPIGFPAGKHVYDTTRESTGAAFFLNAAFNRDLDSLFSFPADNNSNPEIAPGGGEAYRAACRAAGVPIPPDFGPGSAWVEQGEIPQTNLFILAGLGARVLTYKSSSPEGMCIALPRYDLNNNSVKFDGVICLGKATSKACFWDNKDEATGTKFEFPLGGFKDFDEWGAAPFINGGDTCSDCHAGENPYIIHPDPTTILGGLADIPLPTFGNTHHDPLINSTWPNPNPITSPRTCIACHGTATTEQSLGGRLPRPSTALADGYCNSILRAAIGAMPFIKPDGTLAQNPSPTMPQGTPGRSVCTPNLPPTDSRFRACTPAMTESCNLDQLDPSDPFYLRCAPDLSALLNLCTVAPGQ